MYIPRMDGTMWNIVFVCVENACRSQMAEAWARHLGHGRVRAWSAGSRPAKTVDPFVRLVMRERGIDLGEAAPKGFDALPETVWDAVVTMGCGEECPWIPARLHVRWEIPDPRGRSLDVFREVRDEIERRVRELLEILESARAEEQPAL
jgi:arsenate reductase